MNYLFWFPCLVLISLLNFVNVHASSGLFFPASNPPPLILAPKVLKVYTIENLIALPLVNQSFYLEIATKDGKIFGEFYTLPAANDSDSSDLMATMKLASMPPKAFVLPIRITNCTYSQEARLSVINEDGDVHTKKIFLSTDVGFAFVQTDKPIYTPKETVKIRLMRLDEDFKPLQEPVRVQITNPSGIIMEDVTLNEKFEPSRVANHFFMEYQFKIPPDPIKQSWSVSMLYGPSFSMSTITNFTVKEYVLPPFQVTLKSPMYISPSRREVNGSVEAFYLSNSAPVSGSARFVFKVKTPSNKVIPIGQTADKKLVEGKTEYWFTVEEFQESDIWFPEIDGSHLLVEVTVVEEATATKIKKSDTSTRFLRYPYTISFGSAYKQFRSEKTIPLSAEIFQVNGEPAANVRAEIWVVNEEIRKAVVSDDRGRLTFNYTPQKGTSKISYQVRLKANELVDEEQTSATHSLTRFNVTQSYLTISNKQDRYKVGDKFQSQVIFEGSTYMFNRIYYVIIIRGKIHKFGVVPHDDVLRFDIEPNMASYFRLTVFSYRSDRIVSDSILITVDDSNDCGLRLTYQNAAKVTTDKLRPGETGSLLIQTDSQYSEVALQAVDEAVYMLQDKEVLNKRKILKQVRKKDLGCGPGGGYNPNDIILNSGLIIVGIDHEKDGSYCKQGKKKVTKRETDSIDSISKMASSSDACCQFGMKKDKKQRPCFKRQIILLNHLKNQTKCGKKCTDCAKKFLECCRFVYSDTPTLAMAGNFLPSEGSILRDRTVSVPFLNAADEDQIEEDTLTRDDFRETWLFNIVAVNKSSSYSYPVKAPHSITSWAVDAFSLSTDRGFCIMEKPLRLRTTQQLFLRVDLPYSVVQDEQVEMLATIFNYSPTRVTVRVYMEGPEGVCSEADPGQKSDRRIVSVEPKSAYTVGFALLPLKVGELNITVVALASKNISDKVVKTLRVVPRGIEVNDEYRIQLDPQNRQRRKKRRMSQENLVDVIDPDRGEQKTKINLIPKGTSSLIVPESEECIISAIADRIGPTIESTLKDLDHLIRKPGGCGEQNIIFMAPTLFTLDYLNSTKRLKPWQLKKGTTYLQEGYKQQLMFRNQDGSYSAFRSKKSSIWLTAFVMKIFCKSAPYIGKSLDPQVIHSGLKHLISSQKHDGSWLDPEPVVHKKAMGGIKGILPNTAFILNALTTCQHLYPLSMQAKLNQTIESAERFLCNHVKRANYGAYVNALMAYSLTNSSCLDSTSKESLFKSLKKEGKLDTEINQLMWPKKPVIETAGYALLAFLGDKSATREEILPVVNFLESQRTFSGSFDATQDTIVALEALSSYAKSATFNDIDLVCNITAGRFKRHIEFHPQNAQVMQIFDVRESTDDIEIFTRGIGVGSVQVRYKYNIVQPKEKLCGFELNISVSDGAQIEADIEEEFDADLFFSSQVVEDLGVMKSIQNSREKRDTSFFYPLEETKDWMDNTLSDRQTLGSTSSIPLMDGGPLSKKTDRLQICVRRYYKEDAGMSIVEVGILSGYVPDDEDLVKLRNSQDSLISKFEKTARTVVFYLSSVPARFKSPYCFAFRTYQVNKVGNLQSALVKVYDYYEKGESCNQVYYSTRRTDHLMKNCSNSTACQCAAKSICPSNQNIEEVGKIASVNLERAKRRFREVLCSSHYDFAWTGRIFKLVQEDQYLVISFKIYRVIKGDDTIGDSFNFTMDSRCGLEREHAEDPAAGRFLVLGKRKIIGMNHLNSKFIFYDLNKETELHTREPVRKLVRKFQEEARFSCKT